MTHENKPLKEEKRSNCLMIARRQNIITSPIHNRKKCKSRDALGNIWEWGQRTTVHDHRIASWENGKSGRALQKSQDAVLSGIL